MIPRTHLEEETSLEFWYKTVESCGIPSPKTVIVHLSDKELEDAHNEHVRPTVVKKIIKAAKEFGYPFFLRTDLSSGKHSWNESCYVSDPTKVSRNVHEVVVYNLLVGFFGLPFRSFAVREYIPLEGGTITAFHGGFPVTKERRVFVRDGEVECHHEYWVEDAIKQGMSGKSMSREEWLPLLEEINSITDDELQIISEYARKVGKCLGGYWSVDFAKTADGRWILIDMGRGELSFHKHGCKYNVVPKLCNSCGTRMSNVMYNKYLKCRRCREEKPTKEEKNKDEFERTWSSPFGSDP